MSLSLFKKFCIGSMLGFVAWTTTSFAQTPVTVNGAACAGASVSFSSSGIAINTGSCGGGTVTTPPSFTSSTPSAATVGVSYSHTFMATNSPAWSITGSPPAGMTFNSSNGVLSGSPSAAGTTSFTVNATNSAGSTPQAVTFVVNPATGPAVITSAAPPAATLGVSYSFTLTASGAQPITWTVTGLPAGLSHTSGVISGTPTAAGTANVMVTAANGAGADATATYSLVVSPPAAPTFTSAAPAAGVVGISYTHTFAVSTTTAVTWSISGTPPNGLSFNTTTGVLSGTPSTAGSSTFTVTATNAGGPANQAVTLQINAPGSVPDTSVENVVIPTPSKFPNVVPNPRNGQLNGAGPDLNAYAVDVSRCAGKTSPTLTRSWQHNIEFASYAGESPVDYVTMNAGEALSFRFVAPATGYRFITFNPATLGRYVGNFLSISTSPCDFNDAPPSNMRACYAARNSGNNDITYQVIGTGAPDISACKLTPGTVYYFNLRFWDKVGGNPVDACAVDTVANGFNCGGILQIR